MACSSCGRGAQRAIQVAGQIISSLETVKPEVREYRHAICKKCEHYKRLTPQDFSLCKICKCIVAGKTWLKTQKCPIDKWDSQKEN